MNSIRNLLTESMQQMGMIEALSIKTVCFAMLVAFICSIIIYAVYRFFYKGVSYHSMGNEDLALENYSISIEKDKKMIDAYFNRGQILMKAQPKKALDDFASAIALDPKFLDAYYSVAVIQRKLGQLEEAVKNLDKIIELEPNAVNAKALKKLILKKGKG